MVLDFLFVIRYIAKTLYGEDEEEVTPQNNQSVEEPKLLGLHPVSSEKVAFTADFFFFFFIHLFILYGFVNYKNVSFQILLKSGPYGFYVQLGEDRKGYMPKRTSVSQV